jgi:23S rRNA (uridine2552-2'-O)-methyltransferase
MKSFTPKDHYFYLAKKQWLVARSFFKLEEIDQKYSIFDKSSLCVLDIWCAPGSRIQYADQQCSKFHKNYVIIWFDILKTKVSGDRIYTFQHDVTDQDFVWSQIKELCPHGIDCIISDMAPNTTGFKQIDAMRSIDLLRETLYIYQQYLKKNWKCVIKCFMWPGFDEFVKEFKQILWWSCKIVKPQASRSASKEVYIVKYK